MERCEYFATWHISFEMEVFSTLTGPRQGEVTKRRIKCTQFTKKMFRVRGRISEQEQRKFPNDRKIVALVNKIRL